jgi:hypothetical protein
MPGHAGVRAINACFLSLVTYCGAVIARRAGVLATHRFARASSAIRYYASDLSNSKAPSTFFLTLLLIATERRQQRNIRAD